MRIAVVIGHDKSSPGAYSPHLGMSEYIYNSEVSTHLAGGMDIYKRPIGGGYSSQMKKLADIINPLKYDLVVELHFNSFNKSANGCEVVIFKGNKYTQQLGQKYCDLISGSYKTKNRGVKEVSNKNDRGYGFLSAMNADAMILEPFFGDHEEALLFKNPAKLAELIRYTFCN